MGFNWGSFFSAGVEELGEVAQAKDASVAAEAKAQAEEFAEKQEAYEDEMTKNKRLLRQEVDSIRGLGIKDVGKIRTVMKTYGNTNVIKSIEEDFAKYQQATIEGRNDGKFKTMADYIKGRITGTGTAMLSDEAAEQAEDEAAIAGDELDIQKASQRAKAQGITLEQYLQNQAIKMSDRPAFNLNARAARLVEESKMGIFGKTLTLEEAKKKILAGKTMEGAGLGAEAKDLGETGYALEREGGLSTQARLQTLALVKKAKESRPDYVKEDEIEDLKKDIYKSLGDNIKVTTNPTTGENTYTSIAGKTKQALIEEINKRLKFQNSLPEDKRDEKGITTLELLLKRAQMDDDETKSKTSTPKTPIVLSEKMKNAIKIRRNKYKRSDEELAKDLVKTYGGKITQEQALEMIKGV